MTARTDQGHVGGARVVGILAGGGSLPREIAESLAARGARVHLVAIEGEADQDFGAFPVTHVNWGQIGGMIRAMKSAKTDAMVIVGRVTRPDVRKIKTDLGFFRNLPQIFRIVASGGDDSVLRRVVRFFEGHGLTVIGPGDAAPELLAGSGALGAHAAGPDAIGDSRLGFALVRALAPFDVGQGAVIARGRVVAIEGVEGTDRMLGRVKGSAAPSEGGVLVKRPKPGQDLRVDLPAIGPETVARVQRAGLSGIALEAGRVLILDRAETLRKADASSVFIAGSAGEQDDAPARFKVSDGPARFAPLGRVKAQAHHLADAEKGLAVLRALASFRAGRAAAVMRQHVLAVAADGEGAVAVIERARGLRQWASLTRRRRGVLVIQDDLDLTRDLVQRVEAAGYAGLAIGHQRGAGVALADGLSAADAAGLFVVAERT